MANCSPCPVETSGKLLFPPHSSAAVPKAFETLGTSPGVLKQGKDQCWCSQCPPAKEAASIHLLLQGGLFVPARTLVLDLIPLDGFMASWGRQSREGVGFPSQVSITQVSWCTGYPKTQTQRSQHCTFTWVPQHPVTPIYCYTSHTGTQPNTLTHQYTPMHSGTQHMAVLEQGHPKTQPLALRYLSAPAMPCVAPAWAQWGLCCSLGQVRLVQFPFNPKHHEPYSKGNAKGF